MVNRPHNSASTHWSLIERLKNWDDQAGWQEFYDTYAGLIYGVAIKSGLSSSEAEEVVQETIMSVSKKMKDFKAVSAAGSRLTTNVSLNLSADL